jgi:hypothetical protein
MQDVFLELRSQKVEALRLDKSFDMTRKPAPDCWSQQQIQIHGAVWFSAAGSKSCSALSIIDAPSSPFAPYRIT